MKHTIRLTKKQYGKTENKPILLNLEKIEIDQVNTSGNVLKNISILNPIQRKNNNVGNNPQPIYNDVVRR